MEKTIETIWKEGFEHNNNLIAPRINSIYTRKSKHIIDKFKRMFRINLYGLVAFSFVILVVAYFTKIPLMGVFMFLILNGVVLGNRNIAKTLYDIKQTDNTYDYLIAFDQWLTQNVNHNKKMARVYYPVIVIAMFSGFWYGDFNDFYIGQKIVDYFSHEFPNHPILLNVPAIIFLGLLIIMGLLSYFSGALYQMDYDTVYGRITAKLKETLADIEELRH